MGVRVRVTTVRAFAAGVASLRLRLARAGVVACVGIVAAVPELPLAAGRDGGRIGPRGRGTFGTLGFFGFGFAFGLGGSGGRIIAENVCANDGGRLGGRPPAPPVLDRAT
jgi:hypothetical protein